MLRFDPAGSARHGAEGTLLPGKEGTPPPGKEGTAVPRKEGAPARRKARQFGFVFYQDRCTGCKACERACCDYHGLPSGKAHRKVREYAGSTWRKMPSGAWEPQAFSFFLSASCNHCTNPVCVRFCSAGALAKDADGFVVLDALACTGCQLCMVACPYHAISFDEERGVAAKCDGCCERVQQGGIPACVEACPHGALTFGLYADISDHPSLVEKVQDMPEPYITQPNYSIEMSEAARGHAREDCRWVNPDE